MFWLPRDGHLVAAANVSDEKGATGNMAMDVILIVSVKDGLSFCGLCIYTLSKLAWVNYGPFISRERERRVSGGNVRPRFCTKGPKRKGE